MTRLFLPGMATASCLGMNKEESASSLFRGMGNGLQPRLDLTEKAVPVGSLPRDLPELQSDMSKWNCRNNRLLAMLADEIRVEIEVLKQRFGSSRIAIVLGTSTSGISEGADAMSARLKHGKWPDDYEYQQQETGGGASFLAQYLGIDGLAYVVATACSSSARALASARRLVRAGLADAAIAGGADTLCKLTLAGFGALGALAPGLSNPFSINRNGINIGEGGALFVLSPEPAAIELAGLGESSDAHHVSAPDPSGRGAEAAILSALRDAQMHPSQISYVNLHGTGTALNDSMEALAMERIFGGVPCSSTKAMTGHTLGGAGALETSFLWLTLSPDHNRELRLPPHLWDGQPDPALAQICLTDGLRDSARGLKACLSTSYAFGGNNAVVILRRHEP